MAENAYVDRHRRVVYESDFGPTTEVDVTSSTRGSIDPPTSDRGKYCIRDGTNASAFNARSTQLQVL